MLKRLFSMSGFKLGLLLTLLFCTVKLYWITGSIGNAPLMQFLPKLENSFSDLKMLIRGGPETDEERLAFQKDAHVVILAIDEKSLRMPELGLWPWPREKIAIMVEQLLRCEAKVVGFDVVFAEPDASRIMPVLEELQASYAKSEQIDPAFSDYLEKTKKRLDGDARFVRVLEDSDNVVLGYFFFAKEEEIEGLDKEEIIKRGGDAIGFGNIGYVKWDQDLDISRQFPPALGVRANLPSLTDAVDHYGFFNMVSDEDHIYRRAPLVWSFVPAGQDASRGKGDSLFPSLTLKMLVVYYNRQARDSFAGDPKKFENLFVQLFVGLDPDLGEKLFMSTSLSIGHIGSRMEEQIDIPVDENAFFHVNFYGKGQTFRHVSAGDMIRGEPEACAAVKDKIVLVGATSVGVYDLRPTPFENSFPGVEIHASIMENIIRGDYLSRYGDIGVWELLFMLIIGLLFSWLLTRFRLTLSMMALLVFSFSMLTVDIKVLFPAGILIHQLLQQIHLFVLFLAIAVYRYATEEREKAKIRNAFQFYLSGDVIDNVLQDTSKLKLGGERRELTVLFSDIRGFTSISEALTPEALTELLNEYLTPMTELVFKYQGTLDKYMGDAIMAIYGAPVPFDDHARAACRTALEMMEELGRMQVSWRKRGVPNIDIGIGLNTGPMSVGNMGSARRFDYTVMGDNVNLGSRLEGSNKQYGTHIIISEHTRKAIGDHFTCRELDLVAVKGKQEPVRIFELVHRGPLAAEEADGWIARFEQGLMHYRQRNWDEAVAVFQALVDERADPPSKIYVERCAHMREDSPEDDWDGVYRMTTK
ncbi:MAG: adenylate/guanylate cyclase domain-containing protein [Deltaproteobacteria bacterium]|nr:adenylate/guanylate cyclase domain-containing protein [Deltaproteobacteria bacterium]